MSYGDAQDDRDSNSGPTTEQMRAIREAQPPLDATQSDQELFLADRKGYLEAKRAEARRAFESLRAQTKAQLDILQHNEARVIPFENPMAIVTYEAGAVAELLVAVNAGGIVFNIFRFTDGNLDDDYLMVGDNTFFAGENPEAPIGFSIIRPGEKKHFGRIQETELFKDMPRELSRDHFVVGYDEAGVLICNQEPLNDTLLLTA